MRERAQIVLVAAAVVALALVPILFAYLQLGYHADMRASERYTSPARDAERVLERAVHRTGEDATGDYQWGQRTDAVSDVRTGLAPRLEAVRESRVERGTVYQVRYNRSTASTYADEYCPGGPDRQFGPCRADRGVVVQRRAGETHVLAVAFDLTITGERRTVEETVVVRVIGGVLRSW